MNKNTVLEESKHTIGLEKPSQSKGIKRNIFFSKFLSNFVSKTEQQQWKETQSDREI